MGDALCGPSNPLQNFRKQTQLDRTLQQDRLIQPRSSGAQGFRSYDPRTGSLDADLHAFEHSGPSPASLQLQQPHPSQAAFSPAAAGWAADFQKLQISHPSTPVSTATPPQPQLAGWGSEFVMHNHNQRVGTPMSDVKGKQIMPEPAVQGNMYNTAAYHDAPFQQQMQMPNYSMYQQPSHQQQQHPILDQTQTDFEAAFAEALASAQAEVTAQDQEQFEQEQSEQNLYNANGVEMEYPPQSHAPIGSDAINYIEQSNRTIDQDVRDADELARTAGQLLDMVKNDSSEKMKNSQFLSLMRQLRDREVEVQNNDLKSTDKAKDRTYMENETDVNPLSLNMQDVQLRQGQEGDADVDMESAQSQAAQNSHADTSTDTATDRSFQPTRDSFEFQFPDMNTVYAQQSLPASGTNTPRNRFAGSWDYPITSNLSAGVARPSSVPPMASAFVAEGMLRGDVGVDTEMNMYSSHDDEYPNASTGAPQSQIQALHPGGRWYPEQKSPISPDLDQRNTANLVDAANHNAASGGADDVMSGAVNTPNTADYPSTPLVNIGTGLMGTGLMGQSGISMSAD